MALLKFASLVAGIVGFMFIVGGLFTWSNHDVSNHLLIGGCALIIISRMGDEP